MLKKGTRVRHITKPDWGVGQVLEDVKGECVKIFFDQEGKKELSTTVLEKIRVVAGEESSSPLLDNLGPSLEIKFSPEVQMAQAMIVLLKKFPGGLHGNRMQTQERKYKDDMRELVLDWYAPATLKGLLENGRYEEVTERAYRLVKLGMNNFPSSFEKMSFADGLKVHTRSREFAEAFCAWVIPEKAEQGAFEAFAKELDHLNSAKWPIITAYRFLLHPQSDVMIKPVNLNKAVKLAGKDVNYRSEMNWLTYIRVCDFYDFVGNAISVLNPKDNIDVQNFIWCIDEEQYPD
jgi:hypothetical protein